MSGRIAVLDGALADQIAAGEVVERPASVVKELLENAVDAGARRVQVDISDGGRARIRVTDDGAGMAEADAALSVRRHATSKLRTLEDLSAIGTLGFRGEALPSIASVSRFSLESREPEAVAGTRVEIEGGETARIQPAGCAPGTTVEVRDLFYNVPARLKFLKARATESGHVSAVCMRTALANPGLALTLRSDGRRVREYLSADSFIERARAAFPHDKLGAIEERAQGISLEAALGAPERARSGMAGLHLFVNGRPVRDPPLARAVSYAYGSVLPPGRYPIGALSLRIDPAEVDVNVHPQKHEVRFANGRRIYDAVSRMLAKHLGTTAWSGPAARAQQYWDRRLPLGGASTPAAAAAAPHVGSDETESVSAGDPWGLAASAGVAGASGVADARAETSFGAPRPDAPTAEAVLPNVMPVGFFGSLRVLGQVRRMLLICEAGDALHVIDQHAADERVRYDRLRRAHAARSVETQRLLFPERVECSESEATLVDEQAEALQAMGLDCTRLGQTTVAVHAVPALLTRATPERLLKDVLVELERAGERAFSDAIDMALATMACHGAIRAGDVLSNEQAQALLANMDEVEDFAGHCPHGRPVVHTIPLDALARKLGR
ncbi:MAG: DNA mismatch repair endonuclease MutL [Myxococcales bacterium]|nr:DNA mismatch repair endonuclease MutL [Myxococcales bacterium]